MSAKRMSARVMLETENGEGVQRSDYTCDRESLGGESTSDLYVESDRGRTAFLVTSHVATHSTWLAEVHEITSTRTRQCHRRRSAERLSTRVMLGTQNAEGVQLCDYIPWPQIPGINVSKTKSGSLWFLPWPKT